MGTDKDVIFNGNIPVDIGIKANEHILPHLFLISNPNNGARCDACLSSSKAKHICPAKIFLIIVPLIGISGQKGKNLI